MHHSLNEGFADQMIVSPVHLSCPVSFPCISQRSLPWNFPIIGHWIGTFPWKHCVSNTALGGIGLTTSISMRANGKDIFFERTSVLERRFESSNEDSNSKIVFPLIAIQLNPMVSKLLGRIAAKAQQQQRAHQIDRRLTQIFARTDAHLCHKDADLCQKEEFLVFPIDLLYF